MMISSLSWKIHSFTLYYTYLNIDHSRTGTSKVKTTSQQQSTNDEGKETTVHERTHVVLRKEDIVSRLLNRIEEGEGQSAYKLGWKNSAELLVAEAVRNNLSIT